MEHVVFLKVVAILVLDDGLLTGVLVVGIDFLATLVAHKEDGFDAAGGLRADTHGASGCNGQQGDIWDAQKDMALAMLGSTIMLVYYLVKFKLQTKHLTNGF